MLVALTGLGIFSLFELLLWFSPFWRWRRVLASGIIIGLSVFSGLVFGDHFAVWSAGIVILSLYRMVNLLRLVQSRTQADYLFHVARKSSIWLIGLQILVLDLAALNHYYRWSLLTWLYGLVLVQIAMAVVLLASTLRHLRTTRPPDLAKHYADKDLPSLTVAIPARNETDDLEVCLTSLVQSNYPKLEILVLDDCSQDKRTPGIIRDFAQSGVNFMAGKVPPEHWLAKNYAYQQLADAANGELLLFCGVDSRFQPDTLRSLVETLLAKKKTMLSVMPRNQQPGFWDVKSLLVQPSRYAWELSLPRRWLNRPPVLSTCWLITAEALHAAGNFKAIAHSNSPESYFARFTARTNDGYSFLRSTDPMGLTSAKGFAEQKATAVRTRYPQLHRRPELVGLLSLLELLALAGSFVVLLASLFGHVWLLVTLSAVSVLLLTVFYVKIVTTTYQHFLWRSLWLLPVAVIYDIGLLNYSMWQYEFGEILWKGRNVCIPIMRAIPVIPAPEPEPRK